MQRLLSEFGTMFDLDQTVHGARLGDLVIRTIDELESKARPDWGSVGPIETRSVSRGESTDFYYAPHLFPDMEQTLRLAHKLQFHMLPLEAPADSPVKLAAVLESYCHLSGDLFGWEVLSDGPSADLDCRHRRAWRSCRAGVGHPEDLDRQPPKAWRSRIAGRRAEQHAVALPAR